MKALSRIRGRLAGTEGDADSLRDVSVPEFKISIVRVKPQPRKHKVISFGYRVTEDGEVPESYQFQYLPDPENPEDLHPGVVPAGFSSGVPVDDAMVYFHTREGSMGPEYQVVYAGPDSPEGDVPSSSMVFDWRDDVDALWVEAMQRLEESHELSEDALAFLDADPLWLFGVADPATQRALEKTAVVPMLRCIGQRPCLEEWFAYLNADVEADMPFKWVIESFMEVDLPQPWTSFKGVGSIVCYLNNETNETTWKHPFYDYFANLLNICRRATNEEHIKLRINRVLWSYEAESQTDVHYQMPLVSPKYVKTISDILGVDLIEEPCMVRTLKTFLKAFSQMYHEGELDSQEVKWCLEIVDNERAKNEVAKTLPLEENTEQDIDSMHHGPLHCIECGHNAACYCPDCGDCLCLNCFERLHEKGNRTSHIPNYIIPCVVCKNMPAKLQCTYSRGNYCVNCYDTWHKKTLPKFLDLKPLRIDYKSKRDAEGKLVVAGQQPPPEPKNQPAPDADPEQLDTFSKYAPMETTLGEKWHAFYDLRGVKYYYNFETQESMRRPQDEKLLPEGTEEIVHDENRMMILGQLAMAKDARLLHAWKHHTEVKVKDRPGVISH
mmetsp:Transcript_51941/g.121607  ORF Transcript_51941/g.121607 Transcript_51941/m.121607 type:complete len:609 (+) Transcript_51941:57-1883(+)